MPELNVTVDGKPVAASASTIRDVIKDKRAIAARVNGVPMDLATSLADGMTIETITPDTPEGLHLLRHSTAHVMAEAVKALFPDAKPTIGPATETVSTTTSICPAPSPLRTSRSSKPA